MISFAALRRLRFKGFDLGAETAARTAIAALGVAAIAYQHETDFDLRSRCLLLPTHPLDRYGAVEAIPANARDWGVKARVAAHLAATLKAMREEAALYKRSHEPG